VESERIFSLLEKVYAEVQETKAEVKKANARIDSLEVKVDKNTMLLERVSENTEILAEVQQSFSQQLERAKDKDGKTLGERIDIIELAVSNTYKSLQDNFLTLNGKMDDLQIDINNLTAKTAKTDSKVIQFERLLSGSDKKQG
jgi:outer membrane murein-binding lipoprotein Lpp